LIIRKVELDLQNADGSTALHLAVYSRSFDNVRLLVDAGAALDIKNNKGLTPLAMVLRENSDSLDRSLLNIGVCLAIASKEILVVKGFIKNWGRTSLDGKLLLNQILAKVLSTQLEDVHTGLGLLHCYLRNKKYKFPYGGGKQVDGIEGKVPTNVKAILNLFDKFDIKKDLFQMRDEIAQQAQAALDKGSRYSCKLFEPRDNDTKYLYQQLAGIPTHACTLTP